MEDQLEATSRGRDEAVKQLRKIQVTGGVHFLSVHFTGQKNKPSDGWNPDKASSAPLSGPGEGAPEGAGGLTCSPEGGPGLRQGG